MILVLITNCWFKYCILQCLDFFHIFMLPKRMSVRQTRARQKFQTLKNTVMQINNLWLITKCSFGSTSTVFFRGSKFPVLQIRPYFPALWRICNTKNLETLKNTVRKMNILWHYFIRKLLSYILQCLEFFHIFMLPKRMSVRQIRAHQKFQKTKNTVFFSVSKFFVLPLLLNIFRNACLWKNATHCRADAVCFNAM